MSNVTISPISPDSSTTGRYGSSDDRAEREYRPPDESPDEGSDRLEISSDARRTYRMRLSGPDVDFARKALDKSPGPPESRFAQILHRIESGYYGLPQVVRTIARALLRDLR